MSWSQYIFYRNIVCENVSCESGLDHDNPQVWVIRVPQI